MGEKSKLKAGRASAAGGWGQQSKLKAGRASAAGGKPPFRHHSGKVCKCRPGSVQGCRGQASLAPLRVPDWQRQPATEKKTPPPETTGGGVREKSIS